jgi:hypothetical protein
MHRSVQHNWREARDFRVEVPAAADNSRAICPLRASLRVAVPQRSCLPATSYASAPKNSPGQIAENPERQCQLSDVSESMRGQFEERKPSARESGERRAKGGEPSRGSHSGTANPAPSPQKTWRVREKLGEFEKTRGFSTTKLGEFEKRGETRVKSQSSHRSSFIIHRSSFLDTEANRDRE